MDRKFLCIPVSTAFWPGCKSSKDIDPQSYFHTISRSRCSEFLCGTRHQFCCPQKLNLLFLIQNRSFVLKGTPNVRSLKEYLFRDNMITSCITATCQRFRKFAM